ncbi:MAG TPA: STM3941 family protein [Candidatus Polarisedimenticolia bacterium]|nr:STM3941 family protein [Candidatus Polarisedimenticolia bacterium]
MECYPSKLKLLGLLALTCAMVGVCYFCTTLAGLLPQVVGWIGVGFFGLGFIVIPVLFFRSGPQVLITHEGIDDRRLKIGTIPWEAVRSLSIRSVEATKFLCVELFDPEAYLSRLPRWTRPLRVVAEATGLPALTVGFSGLTPGIKEVWAHLQSQARGPNGSALRAALEPERRFVVRLSGPEVLCERPDGTVERVHWADLQSVEVLTTDKGPHAPDVFWVLHGTDGGCVVPQGATGDGELLERLQRLPGFDNKAFIEAMGSSANGRFLCWRKPA